MNYKIIILFLVVAGILIIVYLEINNTKQAIVNNNRLLERHVTELNVTIDKHIKHAVDKYIDKVKKISEDNLNQLKKINSLNHQTVNKINHFTETMDSDKKSDINYFSDMIQSTKIPKQLSKKPYYMSDESSNTLIDQKDMIHYSNSQTSQTNSYQKNKKKNNTAVITNDLIKHICDTTHCEPIGMTNIIEHLFVGNSESSNIKSNNTDNKSSSYSDDSSDHMGMSSNDIFVLQNTGNMLNKIDTLLNNTDYLNQMNKSSDSEIPSVDQIKQYIELMNGKANIHGFIEKGPCFTVTELEYDIVDPIDNLSGRKTDSFRLTRQRSLVKDMQSKSPNIDLQLSIPLLPNIKSRKPVVEILSDTLSDNKLIYNKESHNTTDQSSHQEDIEINIHSILDQINTTHLEDSNITNSINNIINQKDSNDVTISKDHLISLDSKSTEAKSEKKQSEQSNSSESSSDAKEKFVLKDSKYYSYDDLKNIASEIGIRVTNVLMINNHKKIKKYTKEELYNILKNELSKK